MDKHVKSQKKKKHVMDKHVKKNKKKHGMDKHVKSQKKKSTKA